MPSRSIARPTPSKVGLFSLAFLAAGCLMEHGQASDLSLAGSAPTAVAVYRVAKRYRYLHSSSTLDWDDETLALWIDSTGSHNPRALASSDGLPFPHLNTDGQHRALFPDTEGLSSGQSRRRLWYPWGLVDSPVEEWIHVHSCYADTCQVRFERSTELARNGRSLVIRQEGEGVVTAGRRYLEVNHRFQWSRGEEYQRDDRWDLVIDATLSDQWAREKSGAIARQVRGAETFDAWRNAHPAAQLAEDETRAAVADVNEALVARGRLSCHRGIYYSHQHFVTSALPEVVWNTLLSLPPSRGRGIVMHEAAHAVHRLDDAAIARIADAARQDELARPGVASIADMRLHPTLRWLRRTGRAWVRERAAETLAQLDRRRGSAEEQFVAACRNAFAADRAGEAGGVTCFELERLSDVLPDPSPALRCFAHAAEVLPDAADRSCYLKAASALMFTPLSSPEEVRTIEADPRSREERAVKAVLDGNSFDLAALSWLSRTRPFEGGREAALVALESPEDELRHAAAEVLVAWGDGRGADALATMLEEGRISGRDAANALRLAGEVSALDLFEYREEAFDEAVGRFRAWARRQAGVTDRPIALDIGAHPFPASLLVR